MKKGKEAILKRRTKGKQYSKIKSQNWSCAYFGFMEISINAMVLNCVGLKSTNAIIKLINLRYNMFKKTVVNTSVRNVCFNYDKTNFEAQYQ